jgi:hypothetical protein
MNHFSYNQYANYDRLLAHPEEIDCQEITKEEAEEKCREEAEEIVLKFIDQPYSKAATELLDPIFKSSPAAWDIYVEALDKIVMIGLKDNLIQEAA